MGHDDLDDAAQRTVVFAARCDRIRQATLTHQLQQLYPNALRDNAPPTEGEEPLKEGREPDQREDEDDGHDGPTALQ